MNLFALFAGTGFKERIMKIFVIALIALIIISIDFFTWALCVAAGEADRKAEMLNKGSKEE